MREHRQPIEVPLHIRPEQVRGAIPPRAFLAQGHHHDGIEIALQAPPQSLHGEATILGDRFRHRVADNNLGAGRLRTSHRDAREHRIALDDDFRELLR